MSLTTIATTSLSDAAAYNSSASTINTNTSDIGDTDTPLVSAGSSAPPNPLQKDISALLTDLASGDIRKSSEDLLKLKQDLKAIQGTQSQPVAVQPTQSSGTLEKVVSAISTALNSGSTADALAGLSDYLVQSGQGSGTVLKTTF